MENYKEKYEKALKVASQWHKDGIGDVKTIVECIFPELRESDDERIRKGLIKGLSAMRDIHKHQTFSDDAINIDDAIAWLEKQGEQILANSAKTCKDEQNPIRPVWYNNMDDLIADAMIDEINQSNLPESSKHNRIFWINKHRQKSIEQDTETRDLWVYIREWNDKFGRLPKDEDELATCIDYVMKRQKPTDKIEQKPVWSEEDEKMISLLIKIFEVNHPNEHFKVNPIGTLNMEAISTKEIVDWLKSLKPNHWKPTEEQMEALEHFVRSIGESGYTSPYDNNTKLIYSLLNDLKSL